MCFRSLYPTACLTLQNTGRIKGSQILKAYICGEEGRSGSNSKVCFYWMVFNISKLALIDSKLSLQKEKKDNSYILLVWQNCCCFTPGKYDGCRTARNVFVALTLVVYSPVTHRILSLVGCSTKEVVLVVVVDCTAVDIVVGLLVSVVAQTLCSHVLCDMQSQHSGISDAA